MGDLARQQRARHDTDDLSALSQRGVGQSAHQPDVAPTVDELHPLRAIARPVACAAAT